MSLLKIHDKDNVAVAIDDIKKGEKTALGVTAAEDINKGHKMSLVSIKKGEDIIKYGFPIGHALKDVGAGEWIHAHNVKTNLGEILDYKYAPKLSDIKPLHSDKMFKGYKRPDGRVGVRNEIWIIPTVSCVNRAAHLIAKAAGENL